MNTTFIRWCDRDIGRVLCFILTLCRRIGDIFRRKPSPEGVCGKILFIKLVEQGSTVLAYPALQRAASFVGRENLYFLVCKENRPILDILDSVPADHIIEVDSGTIVHLIFTIIKALLRIRREGIDAVVDMEFFSRGSAILAYLTGAQKRVGFHLFYAEGPYRGDLFTHRLLYNPYLHTKLTFLSLVEALRHNPPEKNTPMVFEVPKTNGDGPRFIPTEDEIKLLKEKVAGLKKSTLQKPIIILNPNRGDLIPARRWPEENFVRLGKMIKGDYPAATIFISGTEAEREDAEKIASQIGSAVSLAGHTSLRELLTLYYISDILITNDSGPAHFSTLTPIKSIILFGPEIPLLYGPQGEDTYVITSGVVCSPCVSVYNQRQQACATAPCMNSISVEQVLEKAVSLLRE